MTKKTEKPEAKKEPKKLSKKIDNDLKKYTFHQHGKIIYAKTLAEAEDKLHNLTKKQDG